MMAVFDSTEFLNKLKSGELDGRLVEELRQLSEDQLEEVVDLILEQRAQGESQSSS
jgi:hypothetical protein